MLLIQRVPYHLLQDCKTFALARVRQYLCPRKKLLKGNHGSSEANSLARASSLDGPSIRRGFLSDVGVPLPRASPSAPAVLSNLERSHPRKLFSDFGVPLPSASPSALTVEVPLPSIFPSTLAVRRLSVPLPLPRAFPVGPSLSR